MLKRRSKHFALLLVLTMLATMFVGVGAASAAASYTNITAPTVSDGSDTNLGRVKVSFNVNDFDPGNDEVFFKLPKDFKLFENNLAIGAVEVAVTALGTTVIREIANPANVFVTFSTPATSNALYPFVAGPENIAVQLVSDNEFKVTFMGGNLTLGETSAVFQIDFNRIYVPSHDGDIIMTATAPAGSAFSEGSVLVGRSASSGTVTIATTDTQTSDNNFEVTFRITESVPGSLKAENDSIKFRLPNGYIWSNAVLASAPAGIWGTTPGAMNIDANDDFAGRGSDTLSFTTAGLTILTASTAAACFDLVLAFEVEDETLVKAGDINARITGRSSVTPSEIVVGKYGEFDTMASIKSVKEGVAGEQEIEIDDIIIKESIAGSLVNGRSVTIELSSQARWQVNQDAAVGAKGVPANSTTNKGVSLTGVTYTGTDDRTARYTVFGGSTAGAAELKLENLEILVQPGYTGEIVAKFGGTAGVTGEVVIANIVAPIKMEATSKPVIQIGAVAEAGDIIITENIAEAIAKVRTVGVTTTLTLRAPQDVEFAAVPTVERTEGDLKIGTVTRGNGNRDLMITIESDSTVPSTLKVSNIKYKVYRTVPEGNITVYAIGNALIDLVGAAGKASPWPNSTTNGSCVNAVIGTAAAGVDIVDASFVIGSTTYILAGTEQAMDVAPYIKDSRTYMPIRYVAYAMGINDANILWDGDKQTVTLMKGDKVVQLTIGSNLITINGASVTMDVAPEITNDRTMLPIRFVANAFGADAEWDAATQTVTIN